MALNLSLVIADASSSQYPAIVLQLNRIDELPFHAWHIKAGTLAAPLRELVYRGRLPPTALSGIAAGRFKGIAPGITTSLARSGCKLPHILGRQAPSLLWIGR